MKMIAKRQLEGHFQLRPGDVIRDRDGNLFIVTVTNSYTGFPICTLVSLKTGRAWIQYPSLSGLQYRLVKDYGGFESVTGIIAILNNID